MYIWDFSRSLGAGSATTRKTRGLTRSVIALMVPPLPAPSRPSKTMQIFAPVCFTHSWSFTSSTCSLASSFSYSFLFSRPSCSSICSSDPAAALDAQLRQGTDQGGVGGGNLLGGELLVQPRLGAPARLLGLGLVDALGRDGHVGEDGHAIARDLHQPLSDRQELIASGLACDELARHQLRHQPDVLGQDAHLPVHSGQRDHLHVVGVGD